MRLVTISRELNATEAQMKRARLEAAGFHAVVMNEASSIWMGNCHRHWRHTRSSARIRSRRCQGISQHARRMTSKKLKSLHRLKKILPSGEIIFDPQTLEKYAADKWFASHKPDAVALPRSTKSVSTLLRFANRHKIPVTARGGGHGYVGGCVPVRGGIVLSLERMNRIKEINTADFVAVVQSGVNTQKFQEAVEKHGLFYPPDPASRADNFIGGNIATNAGGPHCLKYGVTRDYVLGLEVVLADGTIRPARRAHAQK